MIRARVQPACVPSPVLESILAGTSRSPATAAAAWFFFRSSSVPDVREASVASVDDIVRQSVAEYEAVVQGHVVPQVVSDRPDNVRTYFQGKTGFPVYVPAMRECTLIGGGVAVYRGMRLARVLYRHGRQFIVLYQACRASVMEGDTLSLSCRARSDLDRTGWHCCTAPDGAAIVLWARGRTLCAAVAPMNGEHLMAHLAEADEPGAW